MSLNGLINPLAGPRAKTSLSRNVLLLRKLSNEKNLQSHKMFKQKVFASCLTAYSLSYNIRWCQLKHDLCFYGYMLANQIT